MELKLFEDKSIKISTGEWDYAGSGATHLESAVRLAEDLGFVELDDRDLEPAGENGLPVSFAEFCAKVEPLILLAFAREVDAKAQQLMLKDGKVSGKHYAAMRLILKEKGIEFGR